MHISNVNSSEPKCRQNINLCHAGGQFTFKKRERERKKKKKKKEKEQKKKKKKNRYLKQLLKDQDQKPALISRYKAKP